MNSLVIKCLYLMLEDGGFIHLGLVVTDRVHTFGSCGNRQEHMKYPQGIAVGDTDNIYVSSEHKLQKFTSSGELIKCIG